MSNLCLHSSCSGDFSYPELWENKLWAIRTDRCAHREHWWHPAEWRTTASTPLCHFQGMWDTSRIWWSEEDLYLCSSSETHLDSHFNQHSEVIPEETQPQTLKHIIEVAHCRVMKLRLHVRKASVWLHSMWGALCEGDVTQSGTFTPLSLWFEIVKCFCTHHQWWVSHLKHNWLQLRHPSWHAFVWAEETDSIDGVYSEWIIFIWNWSTFILESCFWKCLFFKIHWVWVTLNLIL